MIAWSIKILGTNAYLKWLKNDNQEFGYDETHPRQIYGLDFCVLPSSSALPLCLERLVVDYET
jgi:hypothetical protein